MNNPGSDVIDFFTLHHAIHLNHRDSPLSLGQYEDAVADYEATARRVADHAGANLHLSLLLLADLGAHLMQALKDQASEGTLLGVLNDWSGRGWTSSIERAGIIEAFPRVGSPRSAMTA